MNASDKLGEAPQSARGKAGISDLVGHLPNEGSGISDALYRIANSVVCIIVETLGEVEHIVAREASWLIDWLDRCYGTSVSTIADKVLSQLADSFHRTTIVILRLLPGDRSSMARIVKAVLRTWNAVQIDNLSKQNQCQSRIIRLSANLRRLYRTFAPSQHPFVGNHMRQ